jgi:hypothetical protein
MLDAAQFAKITFLNHAELSGRTLFSTLFFDGKWHAWIEAGDQLLHSQMWPAEAMYFGTVPEQETDICLHFLDMMGQMLNYLPVGRLFFGLRDDVFNLSASLAKIRLLHRTRKEHKTGVSRMVATEVEYLHGGLPEHFRPVAKRDGRYLGQHHTNRPKCGPSRRSWNDFPAYVIIFTDDFVVTVVFILVITHADPPK